MTVGSRRPPRTINLKIPKVRSGTSLPSLLELRKTSEETPTSVVQNAYVKRVSRQKLDDRVQPLGMSGISTN